MNVNLGHRFATEYTTFWRGTGESCAICLSQFELPISDEVALDILQGRGFRIREASLAEMIKEARTWICTSTYRRGALRLEAPGVFDCSSLVQSVYDHIGISLPRYSINQRRASVDAGIDCSAELSRLLPCDLVFTRGRCPYYTTDPRDGVGHVGLATGEGTAIHGANRERGIVEDPIDQFIGDWDNFRGAGRIIPAGWKVLTASAPRYANSWESIFWSTDLYCIIMQYLGR